VPLVAKFRRQVKPRLSFEAALSFFRPRAMTASADIKASSNRRFFYGWLMLPVAFIAQICTGPGQSYGLTHFYLSFETGLSLSNSQITGAYMCGTLLGCVPL
jgi:hypothetical protein